MIQIIRVVQPMGPVCWLGPVEDDETPLELLEKQPESTAAEITREGC